MRRDLHPLHGLSIQIGPEHWVNARPNDNPRIGGWRVEESISGRLTVHQRAVPRGQAFHVASRLAGRYEVEVVA